MAGSAAEMEDLGMSNDSIVRKLSRLPANRHCINCNKSAPTYVCTTFWTFICHICAGVHREFQHRVKSLSASSFTAQEATALKAAGNERAREVLLNKWDRQRNEFPNNSNADELRTFIKNVYVEQIYKGERNTENKQPGAKDEKDEDSENRRSDGNRGFQDAQISEEEFPQTLAPQVSRPKRGSVRTTILREAFDKILPVLNPPGKPAPPFGGKPRMMGSSSENSEENVRQSNGLTSFLQQYEATRMEDINMEIKILECILSGSKNPGKIKFHTLQFITKKFSHGLKIGDGGCAEVYKGILENGIIAVKKLFSSRTIDDKMFHQEVNSLMMVKHKNVVRMLGYCSHTEEESLKSEGKFIMAENRERLLCFEYMKNGSLESYITDELRGLEWQTRYQIIKGICDGLDHLHNEHIIHMDLKPANVLLDESMVPKITDFGLSRFDDISRTLSLDRLLSIGYCAPEYRDHGRMSAKSDIYSLGIMIQELVTGSRGKPNTTNVYRRWKHRWNKSGTDEHLWYKQVATCLDLAQRCTHNEPEDRPDIGDIISDLKEVDSSDVRTSDATAYLGLEDMLGIKPLEIHLPFEVNKQASCHIELTNDTGDHFAFKISKTSLRPYCIKPNKGILPPWSKCSATITLQAQEKALSDNPCKDEFSVRSTRVDGSLTETDIGGDIFREWQGRIVDKVNLMVILSQASTSGGDR